MHFLSQTTMYTAVLNKYIKRKAPLGGAFLFYRVKEICLEEIPFSEIIRTIYMPES